MKICTQCSYIIISKRLIILSRELLDVVPSIYQMCLSFVFRVNKVQRVERVPMAFLVLWYVKTFVRE